LTSPLGGKLAEGEVNGSNNENQDHETQG
jgi:hypothetical protein